MAQLRDTNIGRFVDRQNRGQPRHHGVLRYVRDRERGLRVGHLLCVLSLDADRAMPLRDRYRVVWYGGAPVDI